MENTEAHKQKGRRVRLVEHNLRCLPNAIRHHWFSDMLEVLPKR